MLDYFFKNQNMGIKYKFIEESDNDESSDQDQLEDLLYNCKYDTEHNVLVAVLDDIKSILLLYNSFDPNKLLYTLLDVRERTTEQDIKLYTSSILRKLINMNVCKSILREEFKHEWRFKVEGDFRNCIICLEEIDPKFIEEEDKLTYFDYLKEFACALNFELNIGSATYISEDELSKLETIQKHNTLCFNALVENYINHMKQLKE